MASLNFSVIFSCFFFLLLAVSQQGRGGGVNAKSQVFSRLPDLFSGPHSNKLDFVLSFSPFPLES